MSIIEISFHLLKCNPTMNYANYIYTIVSEETGFNNTITYANHNTITDQIDYKTDLQYHLKVYDNGELVGVSNFKIPNQTFYKKEKKTLKELLITLSEKGKKQTLEETGLLNMSVKILITFNYVKKKIGYLKRRASFDNKISKVDISDISRTPNGYENGSQKKIFDHMCQSLKCSANRSSATSKKTLNRSVAIPSEINIINKMNTNINDSTEMEVSNDGSVIASLIGRDDVSYDSESDIEVKEKDSKKESIDDVKTLKKKLTYDPSTSASKGSLTNNEMKEKIIQLSSKFIGKYKYYSNRLNKALEEEKKMMNYHIKYNEKNRNIKKKEHRLEEHNDIYAMKNQIISEINKNNNKVRSEAIKSKKNEIDICYILLEDLGLRKKEDDFEHKTSEKDFMIEVFKDMLAMKGSLGTNLVDFKKKKFDNLCDRYNLRQKDASDIEEEENEDDNTEERKSQSKPEVNSKAIKIIGDKKAKK